MIINKDALETAKKALKTYTPETLNGALGYAAFIAPFENMPEEAKARMIAEVQKEVNRARNVYDEGS